MGHRFTAFGCALLAAVAPLASGHLNNNAGEATTNFPGLAAAAVMRILDSGDSTNADGCRYLDSTGVGGIEGASQDCVANSGPSGNYVNAGYGFFLEHGSMPIDLGVSSVMDLHLFPSGSFGQPSGTICDLEVLDNGKEGDLDDFLNEQEVEGGGAGNTPQPFPFSLLEEGLRPDGLSDDGGDGAVCHYPHYLEPTYNTVGCGGSAHAEDILFGGDVWLVANCDWLADTYDYDPQHLVCGENSQFGELERRHPGVTIVCVKGIIQVSPEAQFSVCGGDGFGGARAYGRGGGDAPALGVRYPVPTECTNVDGVAWAAVMNSVQVPGPTGGASVLAGCSTSGVPVCVAPNGTDVIEAQNFNDWHVNTYLAGWIDFSIDPGTPWADGGGFHVQVLPGDGCSDGLDNDADNLPGGSMQDLGDQDGAGGQCDSSNALYESTNPMCLDGLDNDLDGFTDYVGGDPGCSSIEDDNELDPMCMDGADNDLDGLTDYPDDPGCHDVDDENELDAPV